MTVWDSHRVYECETCSAASGEGPTLYPPQFWFTVECNGARKAFCSAECVAAYHAPIVIIEPGHTVTIGLKPGRKRQTLTFEEKL